MRISRGISRVAMLGAVLLVCQGPLCAQQGENTTDPASLEFFQRRILPVLVDQCYECHSVEAGKDEGGLLVDNQAALLQGGTSGPGVEIGDPSASLILSAIRHEDFEMPQGKPQLSASVIADFERWIEAGAVDSRGGSVGRIQQRKYSDRERDYWAFQKPVRVKPPEVRNKQWPRNAIDRFILAKLEEHRLQPSPPASKHQLVRRLSFDLLGLPPTPSQVAEFVNDDRADAYARLVDRLLESHHYGEKWGQLWLDVIRFAESEGFEYDRALPDAWRFRDYVIRSFNEDKPYDQFVREQVAGDQLDNVSQDQIIAVGFHRFGPVRRNAGNPDIALSRNEVLTERTNIIGSAFLGLTLGCARCHDHKFDPIAQRDYYALQAFLAATQEYSPTTATEAEQQAWEEQSQKVNDQLEALEARLGDVDQDQRQELKRKMARLKSELPPPLPALTSIRDDREQRTEVHVLKRGVWENKGDRVWPRPLGVLVGEDVSPLPAGTADLRLHLANWLTDPENPLTARVIVNRIWQGHFGVGLVRTANDFGRNGERPSHPKLLDHLAIDLVEGGWRMKALHRLIVTSSTYRQSALTVSTADVAKIDPENRLLWRFSRRRLRAEEIRDAMLLSAGQLNRKLFGPSVMLPVEQTLIDQLYKPAQWQVTQDTSEHNRRSVYLVAKRNLRLPFMEVFDQPTLLCSCELRQSSTHAPQALELLNGRISNDLAKRFAQRLRRECNGDPQRIVARAYELAIGRTPTPREIDLSVEFLRTQSLEEFALAMFNINAFLYVF